MNGLVSSISAQIILMIASFRSKERGRRICQYIFLQSTTTIIRSVTVTFTTPNIFTPDYCTEKTRNIFETFWSMLLNGTCGDYICILAIQQPLYWYSFSDVITQNHPNLPLWTVYYRFYLSRFYYYKGGITAWIVSLPYLSFHLFLKYTRSQRNTKTIGFILKENRKKILKINHI